MDDKELIKTTLDRIAIEKNEFSDTYLCKLDQIVSPGLRFKFSLPEDNLKRVLTYGMDPKKLISQGVNNASGYIELEAIGGGEVWFSGKERQVELIISRILERYTMKVENMYQCNETILPMSIIGILTPNKEKAEWAERIQRQLPASSQTPVFYEQSRKTLLLPKKGYDLSETTAPLLREYLDILKVLNIRTSISAFVYTNAIK